MDRPCDLAIIGGGINGAGIARDAAGRGLSVMLVEAGDFGGATSSASSKLLHGGLRYLEFGEFGLVRKALEERAILMESAPHLTRPLSFVLPRLPDGRSPSRIRAGLFLYDHLAARGGLPPARAIDLGLDRAGRGLAPHIRDGWRYWDGRIDDSRMVIAILRDAEARGATLIARDGIVGGDRRDDCWSLRLRSGRHIAARRIVNAAGPWAEGVARDILRLDDPPQLRLVRGSHIVVRRPTSAEDALVLQQADGRIVFLIPWLGQYLLIGTTEVEVDTPDSNIPDAAEIRYLLDAANRVLARPLTATDIVHRFAGIRPLVPADGRSARETSRDWRLHRHADCTVLSIVGGKITAYRRLAEAVLAVLEPRSQPWTAGQPLPGANFDETGGHQRAAFLDLLGRVPELWPHHDPALIRTLIHRFGTEAIPMIEAGLGPRVGPFHEAELVHFVHNEYARTAEDILWRRTHAGLEAGAVGTRAVEAWMKASTSSAPAERSPATVHGFEGE